MESLNMSQLSLDGERPSTSNDIAVNPRAITVRQGTKPRREIGSYTKFVQDVWTILLEQEAEKPVFHLQSPQLEYRGALVQKLRDAVEKFDLNITTLHSAVNLLDQFMDAHRLRADRLKHVAFACLSLAAKSEEKFSQAPTLKKLSQISGIPLCGKTFRKLEWMIGQHAKWRLLAPTPASFATLLSEYVVTDSDLTSRHPVFLRRFKRDGEKLLEAYLDLALSDYRLKVVDSVDVGCACVAAARSDLDLIAWPLWLAAITNVTPETITPITRLLQRMMKIMQCRTPITTEVNSPRTAPNFTHATSADFTVDNVCREQQISERDNAFSVLDLEDSIQTPAVDVQNYYNLPKTVDIECQRVHSLDDYRYFRSNRLLEASLVQPSTSGAVKRKLATSGEVATKRMMTSCH